MKNRILISACIIVVMFFTAYPSCCVENKSTPEKEIARLTKELAKVNRASESANRRLAPLKAENDKLKTERALMHEEIGTAYTKAGLFDEAIDAYKESLKYNPNNAQIHYYLGLLYQKSRKDIKKAVFHFKRYLYMNPDAKNKEEVKYFIEMLQNKR